MVATDIDGGRPSGAEWHAELIRQMALDLGTTRPPIITRETAARLDDYRRFRHLIRNIYATNLDPARVGALVNNLSDLWERARLDLERLADFLDSVARSEDL